MRYILTKVLLVVCGILSGVVFMIYRCGYIVKGEKKRANRFNEYFNLLDRWLVCKEQGYLFSDFFQTKNIKSVAICRMGKLGNHLKYELNKAGVTVAYVIDDEEDFLYDNDIHYNIREKLPLVDAVIVTSVDDFERMKNEILKKNKMLNIISMGEITEYLM